MRFPKVSCLLWSMPLMTPGSLLLCLLTWIHRPNPGTSQAGSPGTIKIGAISRRPCAKTNLSSTPCACGSCSKSPTTWRFRLASGRNGTNTRGRIACASTASSPGGDSNMSHPLLLRRSSSPLLSGSPVLTELQREKRRKDNYHNQGGAEHDNPEHL